MPSKDGKVRVLALDGGGCRALITLQMLKFLEEASGERVSELFDLVCGTSTGGLLALALTQPGRALSQLIETEYIARAPEIFHRSWTQKVASLGQFAGPKYDNEALRRCAAALLTENAQLGEAQTPCMVTTYDIQARAPKFYTSWGSGNVTLIDAAMSTTAAPTYFAPWRDNVDGGVCDNNPSLSGVIEACSLYNCTVRDVICVSIGTGSDMKPYSGRLAATWGYLSWLEPLVSIFTDGTSELHAYHLRRLMRDEDVYRFQCPVTGAAADMDNASAVNLRELQQLGAQLVDSSYKRLCELLPRLEGK